MFVVIAGCGRVGAGLAKQLAAEGHQLTMIDEIAEAFEMLGESFPADFVVGQALDWDVLRDAGIERADAFVACTDGDNTNIICAQIAEKEFGVRCAVARVFDPYRADLFAEAGVRTVCPTKNARELLYKSLNECEIARR
jgi:trk/ktr system potassium uptake protein